MEELVAAGVHAEPGILQSHSVVAIPASQFCFTQQSLGTIGFSLVEAEGGRAKKPPFSCLSTEPRCPWAVPPSIRDLDSQLKRQKTAVYVLSACPDPDADTTVTILTNLSF